MDRDVLASCFRQLPFERVRHLDHRGRVGAGAGADDGRVPVV